MLGPDGVPIEPVERYLAFLTDVDRSPNTVKAYAHDLKDWFVFLDRPRVGLAGGPAGGRRGVRGLAAAAAAGAGTGGSSVLPSVAGALRRGDGEPEAVGGQRVLPARRPPRRRPGRAADQLAAGRAARDRRGARSCITSASPSPQARRVIGLKVPRKHPRILTAARDAGDPRRLRPVAGPVVVRGAARHRDADRGGAGAAPRGLGRGRAHGHGAWPGSTTTAPAPSRRSHGRSRSAPGWSGSMPTTCTASTASWTATTCSSISGPGNTAAR